MTFADDYNLRNPSVVKINDIADAVDALYTGGVGGWINAATYGSNGAAIQTAIDTGRNVIVPAGTWDCATEILVTNDYQTIVLIGATLRPTANSMNVIHWCEGYGRLTGTGKFDVNGRTGCTAIRMTPQNEAQTSSVVFQIFNVVDGNIEISGFAEGLVLQCGPDVAGVDSGCWYNKFYNLHIKSCTRGIWLKNGPNANSSGCNRNRFTNIRIGQSGTNTGVHIESGDTGKFIGCAFEGINSGTSPSATPTAIRIATSGTYSGDNNSNAFHACDFEACTRDVDNGNAYTGLFDCSYLTRNFTQNPRFSWGYDLSGTPMFFTEWILLQSGGQIASHLDGINFKGNIALHSGNQLADYSGSTWYQWQNHSLTTSNVTNATSIGESQSKYCSHNNFVEWHFRFIFRATTNNAVVRITLPPRAPETNMYRLYSTIVPMRFPVTISEEGGNPVVVHATLSDSGVGTPYLEIPFPVALWDTTTNVNQIHGQIRYHV